MQAKTTKKLNGSQVLREEERDMLINILKFGDLRVEDVMVPRADVQAVVDALMIPAEADVPLPPSFNTVEPRLMGDPKAGLPPVTAAADVPGADPVLTILA